MASPMNGKPVYPVALFIAGPVWTAVIEGLPGGVVWHECLHCLSDSVDDMIAMLTNSEPGDFDALYAMPAVTLSIEP